MNDDPVRLIESTDVPERARAHLHRAVETPWASYDADSGLARLQAAIAALPIAGEVPGTGGGSSGPPPAAPPAAAAQAASQLGFWGIAATGLAVVGIVGGLIAAANGAAPARQDLASTGDARPVGETSGGEPAPAPREEALPPASVTDRDAPPEKARETANAEPQKRTPPVVASTAARARASAQSSAAPAAVSSTPTFSEELEHVAELRRVAAADPARALALVEEGQTRFPAGQFGHEREAIAIRALARLGRVDQARVRATAFLARYPRSPLRESVARAVGLHAADPNL